MPSANMSYPAPLPYSWHTVNSSSWEAMWALLGSMGGLLASMGGLLVSMVTFGPNLSQRDWSQP